MGKSYRVRVWFPAGTGMYHFAHSAPIRSGVNPIPLWLLKDGSSGINQPEHELSAHLRVVTMSEKRGSSYHLPFMLSMLTA
jgi:hypothetical protein